MQHIPLSQGKVATVDDDDYLRFSSFRWCYRADRDGTTGCAVRHVRANGKDRLSYLHREVMDAPPAMDVIFLNHARLDCRRANLKVVSKQEACRHHRVRSDNRSGVKGVRQHASGRWTASITRGGVYSHVGSFSTKEDALAAYQQAQERST